jgi:hypothetical protein
MRADLELGLSMEPLKHPWRMKAKFVKRWQRPKATPVRDALNLFGVGRLLTDEFALGVPLKPLQRE